MPVSLHHDGLEAFEREMNRSSSRIAVAMVTLGLYVAASLLMLHSVGPRLFGDVPLLALFGYGVALWLSWRLVRSVRQWEGCEARRGRHLIHVKDATPRLPLVG